ncbi:DUF4190 domain-containing protein [Microbacterium sp.]|uniref:DUF4190 domain-containing protein n=1 Tax=Microbacterium sp. TaxID=51671 RepID=UPI002E302A99|nr:DUF4190 domain-containing protein [Microbacterium sp.]HEX5729078.1 DUF4190 domain-containing protein [Microbacterium sp.]
MAKQRYVDPRTGKPARNGTAVAALVLGLLALATGVWSPVPVVGVLAALVAIVPAVLAVAFGHVALTRSRQIGGIGRAAAITGLYTGYVALGIVVVTTVGWIVSTFVQGF